MKHKARLSPMTAFSFDCHTNIHQSNHFKMVTVSVLWLRFAYQNETPNYSPITALTICIGTMNWQPSPWSGIVLCRLLVAV